MRSVRALVLAGAVVMLAGACSSSSSDSENSSGGATTLAPEEVKAPAAEVTKGLNEINVIAADIAAKAATDKAAAKASSDKIEPVWRTIEGTVKDNSPDTYLTFEDSFTALANAADSGDASSAQTAAAAVDKAVTDYLAQYPG